MKFSVKITEVGPAANDPWWEKYDDPRVASHRDAFAYGTVLIEYWNSDLRNHELPRRILNACVTGTGKTKPKYQGQMEMFGFGKAKGLQ